MRLLVARPDGLTHTTFNQLGQQLQPGDLVVVNTSRTMAAAVDGRRWDGRPTVVRFSTSLPEGD